MVCFCGERRPSWFQMWEEKMILLQFRRSARERSPMLVILMNWRIALWARGLIEVDKESHIFTLFT